MCFGGCIYDIFAFFGVFWWELFFHVLFYFSALISLLLGFIDVNFFPVIYFSLFNPFSCFIVSVVFGGGGGIFMSWIIYYLPVLCLFYIFSTILWMRFSYVNLYYFVVVFFTSLAMLFWEASDFFQLFLYYYFPIINEYTSVDFFFDVSDSSAVTHGY